MKIYGCLYLEKEHFPHRADINFQKSPFSTYPSMQHEQLVSTVRRLHFLAADDF